MHLPSYHLPPWQRPASETPRHSDGYRSGGNLDSQPVAVGLTSEVTRPFDIALDPARKSPRPRGPYQEPTNGSTQLLERLQSGGFLTEPFRIDRFSFIETAIRADGWLTLDSTFDRALRATARSVTSDGNGRHRLSVSFFAGSLPPAGTQTRLMRRCRRRRRTQSPPRPMVWEPRRCRARGDQPEDRRVVWLRNNDRAASSPPQRPRPA